MNNPHAFPQSDSHYGISPGMSLRDWFAGQALATKVGQYGNIFAMAQEAYDIADAMLKEREK